MYNMMASEERVTRICRMADTLIDANHTAKTADWCISNLVHVIRLVHTSIQVINMIYSRQCWHLLLCIVYLQQTVFMWKTLVQ